MMQGSNYSVFIRHYRSDETVECCRIRASLLGYKLVDYIAGFILESIDIESITGSSY